MSDRSQTKNRSDADAEVAALVLRFRETGCGTSFGALIERFSGLVEGTAMRVLSGDREAARDVAQDVFADFARMAPRLSPKLRLGGWLHRHTVFLAQRKMRGDRRRRRREREAGERWSLDQSDAPSDVWRRELDLMLDKLPGADRRALVLRFLEGRPLRAVGRALGVSEDAAQKRVSRALEKMRDRFAARGAACTTGGLVAALSATSTDSSAAAAALAKSALSAATATSAPVAGATATLLAMQLKPILISAAAAAIVTSALFVPTILKRDKAIERLELALAERKVEPRPAAPAKGPISAMAAVPKAPPKKPVSFTWQWNTRATDVASDPRIEKWTNAIRQVADDARKQAAGGELLAAISSADDVDVLVALWVWQAVNQVEFDRSQFRPALLELLDHDEAVVRGRAIGMLAQIGKEGDTLERVLAMADDPDAGVRQVVVGSLFWLNGGDLTGQVGETVGRILTAVEEPGREWYSALWGANFTPEVEELLVGWANREREAETSGAGYMVMYQSLSTQNNKGPACVDFLIGCLEAKDSHNYGGRAAWGLSSGVAPGMGSEKKIADAAVTLWKNRSAGYLRQNLLKSIRNFGTAEHAAQLDEIAAAQAMGEKQRAEVKAIADAIRGRENWPEA